LRTKGAPKLEILCWDHKLRRTDPLVAACWATRRRAPYIASVAWLCTTDRRGDVAKCGRSIQRKKCASPNNGFPPGDFMGALRMKNVEKVIIGT
jgi:hypothetical protein